MRPSCTCAGHIRVGGRRPCWRNCESIPAGKITPYQVAPASRRCSPPRNSRVASRSRVNCLPQRSSGKGHPMTSGNSMRHQPHARGGSGQRQSDHHSRCGQPLAAVESYPCLETTNPPVGAYQLMLRRAFLTVGLPRRITLDHGTVFYDNTSPSPFPTRLHLWLLALGIDVCFTRKRCPTDHAKIERTHQTMTLQARHGPAVAASTGVMGRPGCAP